MLSFALNLVERFPGSEQVCVQMVATVPSKGEVPDLVRSLERAPDQALGPADCPPPMERFSAFTFAPCSNLRPLTVRRYPAPTTHVDSGPPPRLGTLWIRAYEALLAAEKEAVAFPDPHNVRLKGM